jgi:hypothetical protein
MDAETTDAVDTLRADIQRVETSVRELGTSLRVDMRESRDDTKRHMDIVAECLRDDIRMIAEGVVALAVKVDSLGR